MRISPAHLRPEPGTPDQHAPERKDPADVSEELLFQGGFRLVYSSADVLGPGQRALQRSAFYLWDAGVVVPGAADGGPAGDWRGDLFDRDVSSGAAQRTGVSYRAAGGDSQRDLWLMGCFCPGAADAGIHQSVAHEDSGL